MPRNRTSSPFRRCVPPTTSPSAFSRTPATPRSAMTRRRRGERAAVMARSEPETVREGMGEAGYFERAGRWLKTDSRLGDGSLLTLVSAYGRSGEVDTPKQDDKYRFLDRMTKRMPQLAQSAD